jgi:ubiquinone/menaquinone biosynthesis C-methylase UbiE
MDLEYKKALQLNKAKTKEYYSKSLNKTEQQKLLERILSKNIDTDKFNETGLIADIACGGGTLSYHLSNMFPNSKFTLVDYNEDALEIAKSINAGDNFSFANDSIYTLDNFADNTFDFVFCWQTLSWIDEPEKALDQLLRITKKGGRVFLSALFNLEHDVDIYSKVYDYTLESGKNRVPFSYNTYSVYSIDQWLNKKVQSYVFTPFEPDVDFNYEGKGLGTFTVNTERGRHQLSGGQLLNWAILEIVR